MKKLQNRQRVAQTINIPCREGCDGTGCLCSMVTTQLRVEDSDGTVGLKVLERRLPGAITIPAARSGNDRSAVLEVPDWVVETVPIKEGVASGRLRLVE